MSSSLGRPRRPHTHTLTHIQRHTPLNTHTRRRTHTDTHTHVRTHARRRARSTPCYCFIGQWPFGVVCEREKKTILRAAAPRKREREEKTERAPCMPSPPRIGFTKVQGTTTESRRAGDGERGKRANAKAPSKRQPTFCAAAWQVEEREERSNRRCLANRQRLDPRRRGKMR